MIRMMDPNPSKRYTLKEILVSNWLETTILEFKQANVVDKVSVEKTLNLWITMVSMDEFQKCIQRAICKSVEIVNIK